MATYKISIKQTNTDNKALSLVLHDTSPNSTNEDITINNLQSSDTYSTPIELTNWTNVDATKIEVSLHSNSEYSSDGTKHYIISNSKPFHMA